MKAYEAAIQILTEAEKPLHVNEISARTLKEGLWKNVGKPQRPQWETESTLIARKTATTLRL